MFNYHTEFQDYTLNGVTADTTFWQLCWYCW